MRFNEIFNEIFDDTYNMNDRQFSLRICSEKISGSEIQINLKNEDYISQIYVSQEEYLTIHKILGYKDDNYIALDKILEY